MALTGHPEFQATEDTVHLKADNGTVRLHGWMPSGQERETMEAAVRNVAGVQGVVDYLQVRSASIEAVR